MNFIFFVTFAASQTIEYYPGQSTANESASFDLTKDSYCFCDLYPKVSDLNCCCDSNKQYVDSTKCLVGSLKKYCIKKFIISRQNIDDWVKVELDTQRSQMCLVYDQNQVTSNFITTLGSMDMSKFNSYLSTLYIPQQKRVKSNSKLVENSWLLRNHTDFFLYPDSFGLCRALKQRIDHLPLRKQFCIYPTTTSCTTAGLFASSKQPTYQKVSSTSFQFSDATSPDGCPQAIEYRLSYVTLVSSIRTNVLSSPYTTNEAVFISTQVSGQTLRSISTEVKFRNQITSQFYNGQAGYKYGQTVFGQIGTAAQSEFTLHYGKQKYSSICLNNTQIGSGLLDPSIYDTLKFGENVQYSCSLAITVDTCALSVLQTQLIFNSFPDSNPPKLSRLPLFAESSSDFIQSVLLTQQAAVAANAVCTFFTTQQVVVYYNEFGNKGARQNYISSVQIGYKDQQGIPFGQQATLRVVVRFVSLAHSQIENTLPPEPSFIPQLPSDIFFPVWYESKGYLIAFVFLCLFLN